MWRKLFNAPWPDAENVLPPAVQLAAEAKIRAYWQTRGWQLVLGEAILFLAAWFQQIAPVWVYGVLALLIGIAYALGFVPRRADLWLVGSSACFLAQGMLVNGLSAVTALTAIVPYTFAGMLLAGRPRVFVQTWCMLMFWGSLFYGVLPILPQLHPPNYLLLSYDILLAAFIFQTMRFLNHLTVEINSAQVASEIRGQSQQFLARVSHELRTPLNSILGFAKLLRRTEFSDTQNQYLSQIVEEGTQLNRLVSDLLDSAHLSTGKLTLRLEPCAITPLCETIAEEQRAALAPSVTLLTHFAPDLPRIDADPIRLRQALGNLVANAVKYTPSGTITITTSANGKAILIEVRDTGIGVSESQQEMIFLPFVQLDDRHVGVGLGLNIAQQIIRLHGGDIKLTSTPGQGSTFTVELPFTQN